jgi:hypothetical protein
MQFFDPFDTDPMETQDWTAVDRYLGLPDNVRLMRFAKAIDENHRGQADGTSAWRSPKHRYVGLFGERAFARIFELPMDLRILKYGNRRKNFTLKGNRVVDVVTRTWETGLSGGPMPELTIRHKPKPTGKIMMLVYYQGEHLEPCIKGSRTSLSRLPYFIIQSSYWSSTNPSPRGFRHISNDRNNWSKSDKMHRLSRTANPDRRYCYDDEEGSLLKSQS